MGERERSTGEVLVIASGLECWLMELVGRIGAIYRYPVKSMAGESLAAAQLGWHGVEGDRRMAFVRSGAPGGFPWLTASKLPSLVTYVPLLDPAQPASKLPTRVRTPSGEELELRSEALRAELQDACGSVLDLIEIAHGIFDDAPLSLIATATVGAITEASGVPYDPRRFRPNFLVEACSSRPFQEDHWVGRSIRIGEGEAAPILAICMRDVRCVMVNLDPDSAVSNANVLQSAVRLNANCAGVYATVIRTGVVERGDPLFLT